MWPPIGECFHTSNTLQFWQFQLGVPCMGHSCWSKLTIYSFRLLSGLFMYVKQSILKCRSLCWSRVSKFRDWCISTTGVFLYSIPSLFTVLTCIYSMCSSEFNCSSRITPRYFIDLTLCIFSVVMYRDVSHCLVNITLSS